MDKQNLINLIKKYSNEEVPIIEKLDITWSKGDKISSLIGQGGFGKVYHIKYKGEEAVLKKISLKRAQEADIKLIVEEAKSLMKGYLYTQYIPKLYGLYKGKIKIGLIMQYIKGSSLHSLYNSIDDRSKLKIFIKITKNLKVLHKYKLIHRDLKPDNIMVNQDNPNDPEVYIIDFGLCKIAKNTKTRTGSAKGTPQYKGPELFDSEEELIETVEEEKNIQISYKVDIWSLGTMISEVFSGVVPWSQRSTNWLHIECLLIEKEAFPIPESIDNERLVELIRRCTDIDPDLRPSDEEIIVELTQILKSL